MTDKAGKNEEISFDFSKVKNLFKRNKKSRKESDNEHEKQDHEKSKDKEDSQNVSLDIEPLKDFFSKYGYLLLILIPLFFAIFFRLQPYYLPITDHWAQDSLDNAFQQQISAQIDQQYPNLPDANKNALIEQELEKAKEKQPEQYNNQLKAISEQYKDHFKDETGQTYLLAIDPYSYYRKTLNIIRNGHPGDELRDGQPWDTSKKAPLGAAATNTFHSTVGVYLYKIVHAINKSTTILNTQFIIPLLFIALAIFPAFFIGRKIAGNFGGFFTALVIAIHPAILSRTIAGFSDTDAYNVFFPLMILWFTLLLFEAKDLKKKIAYAVLTGLSMGLYLYAWPSGWYIIDAIIGGTAIYILYLMFKSKKYFAVFKEDRGKDYLKSIGLFAGAYIIFVSLIAGTSRLRSLIEGPISRLSLKVAAKATLWPNVYTTVAELNEASLTKIIAQLGGLILVLLAVIGIVYLILSKEKKKAFAGFILGLWFFGTLYAATKGIRFTLLMAPAFALGFGAFMGGVGEYLSKKGARYLSISKNIATILFVLFGLLLLGFSPIPPFCTHSMCDVAKQTAFNEVPSFTDSWNNALTKIKDNSEKDAIINSWWDFGHWFRAYADRAVTFDGGSQNTPRAHWIGKTLLTSDEDEAIGILRMLDCGGNTAFDILNQEIDNVPKSVDILYSIIVLDNESAREELNKYVSEKTAGDVLKNTHCQPPEDFFITSSDMVGKSGVWAHFGGWDFEKAKIWLNVKKMSLPQAKEFMKKEFDYSDEEAEKIYYEIQAITNENEANSWISPWPGYAGTGKCQKNPDNEEELICAVSSNKQRLLFTVNLEKETAVLSNSKEKKKPKLLVYVDEEGFKEKEFTGDTLEFSLAIINKGQTIECVMMNKELARSMFTRLFYFNGEGLKHFELFDKQQSLTGSKILTWKVDWEGNAVNNAMQNAALKNAGTNEDSTSKDDSELKEPKTEMEDSNETEGE